MAYFDGTYPYPYWQVPIPQTYYPQPPVYFYVQPSPTVGWKCPECERVFAPYVAECEGCKQ